MTGTNRDASDTAGLRALLSDVVIPVLFPGDASTLPPDLPRRAIEVLDRVGDLEVRWDEIVGILDNPDSLPGSTEPIAALGRNFAADDSLAKAGRTVAFRLSGKRSIAPPAKGAAARLGITLSAEGSLTLEFRNGDEEFDDPTVHKRFLAVRKSLPEAAPTDILAAAVLPQTGTLLGVNTPLKVNLFGLPFSLKFGIVVADRGRIRLFAAGPVVKEIPI